MRNLAAILVFVLLCAFAGKAFAGWEVLESRWRPDKNPFVEKQVWEGFMWAEGWKDPEQFYPKYFKPAGTLHVTLRNNSSEALTIVLDKIDGELLSDISTNSERIGRMIWHTLQPDRVQPGQWTQCVIRLRTPPLADVRLTFLAGPDGKEMDVTLSSIAPRIRMESISFSPDIDRIYIYLKALDGSSFPKGTLRLDGLNSTAASTWTEGPKGSGLMLVECPLEPAWEYGCVRLVEVDLEEGLKLAHPVKVWDNFFSIGMFGDVTEERVLRARRQGINTYVTGASQEFLMQNDMNYVPHALGNGRPRTNKQTGALFYYNKDEPDAHDTKASDVIPWMDRLGLYAIPEVIPRMKEQRDKDPLTPCLVLVNNTYKPLNYYVYGQIADVYSTDPYVPLGGTQLDRVSGSLKVARDACTPKPLIATLWATSIDKHPYGKRPNMPLVEIGSQFSNILRCVRQLVNCC